LQWPLRHRPSTPVAHESRGGVCFDGRKGCRLSQAVFV
jgi:hypothetical protein